MWVEWEPPERCTPPEPLNETLFAKEDFANVTKLKIWRSFWITLCTLNPMIGVLQKRTGHREDHVKMKAEIEMMQPRARSSLVAQWWRICLHAGDSIPRSSSSPGGGLGNPLQDSCLEPGRLWSIASHRVGHYWFDQAAAAATRQGFPSSSAG